MQKTFCWSSLSWKTQFSEETYERVSRLWCVVNTYYKQNTKSSMTAYLLLLSTKKPHVWVILLLLSKFLQIKLVEATVHWKISLRVICKPTLLPPTFFHLCTCSMLHHPSHMWTWRASHGQGWALAMPAAGLCFGPEGTLELVITRQHQRARSCRRDGLSLQAGFSDAGNL